MLRLVSPLPLVLLCLASPSLVACGGEPATEDRAPADSYTTRGLVVALPHPSAPGSELQIHHEAIPEFRDAQGETVGMDSMTMPFPADEELLQGIAVGDRVELDFSVRWEGSPPIEVTGIGKLPADTRLGFEESPDETTDDTDDDADAADSP